MSHLCFRCASILPERDFEIVFKSKRPETSRCEQSLSQTGYRERTSRRVVLVAGFVSVMVGVGS